MAGSSPARPTKLYNMIPLVNKDTIQQRIDAEYEYILRNELPLHDFEEHARKINLLAFRIYVLYRQRVPLFNEKEY